MMDPGQGQQGRDGGFFGADSAIGQDQDGAAGIDRSLGLDKQLLEAFFHTLRALASIEQGAQGGAAKAFDVAVTQAAPAHHW